MIPKLFFKRERKRVVERVKRLSSERREGSRYFRVETGLLWQSLKHTGVAIPSETILAMSPRVLSYF